MLPTPSGSPLSTVPDSSPTVSPSVLPISPVPLSRSPPDGCSISRSATDSGTGCSCTPSEMSSAAFRISRSVLLFPELSGSETDNPLCDDMSVPYSFPPSFSCEYSFSVIVSLFSLLSRINVLKLL